MADSYYQKSSVKQLRRLKLGSPNAGETVNAMNAFTKSAMSDGAVSSKMKHVIAIAVAHATKCPYCIEHHVKSAQKLGATEAEINEAILVAIALNAGAAYTHAGMALDAIDEASAPAAAPH